MAKLVIEDAPAPIISFDKMSPEQQREELNRQVMEARNLAVKEPPAPPPLTARMKARIEAEMEAGRKALEKHAANLKAQREYKVDLTEGTNTPVYRPDDFVPSMSQGKAVHSKSKNL